MRFYVKSPVVIICTFLWIGVVSAISFVEAPLKFQAPGITLPLGLGVGRIVFAALNKVEWVLAVGIVSGFLFSGIRKWYADQFLFLIPLLILIVQTVRLLPALDARAALHMTGEHVAASYQHVYYVACEVVKVVSLAIAGIRQFSGS
jgi:hypothetical protein